MRFVKNFLFVILTLLLASESTYPSNDRQDAPGFLEKAKSCVFSLVEKGVDFMREQTMSERPRRIPHQFGQERPVEVDYESSNSEIDAKIPRRLIRNLFNRLNLDPFSYIGHNIAMLLRSDPENTLQILTHIYEDSQLSIEQQYFLINIIANSHARIPYFVFETVKDWNQLSPIEASFRWDILKQADQIKELHSKKYSSYNEALGFVLSKFIFTEQGWLPLNTLFVAPGHEPAWTPQWQLSANTVFVNQEQRRWDFNFLRRDFSSETENQQADKALIQDLLLLPPGRRRGSHEYFYLMMPQGLLLTGFLRNPENRIKAQVLVEHTVDPGLSELRGSIRNAFLIGAMSFPLAERIIDHIIESLSQGLTEVETKEYPEFLRATHTILRNDPHSNYEDAIRNILDRQEWESPALNLAELTESSSDAVSDSSSQTVEQVESDF